jgi:hypothetical protein
MFDKQNAIKTLRALCSDTPLSVEGYICVQNPDFQEDNGSDPNLVIDVQELIYYLENSP